MVEGNGECDGMIGDTGTLNVVDGVCAPTTAAQSTARRMLQTSMADTKRECVSSLSFNAVVANGYSGFLRIYKALLCYLYGGRL